MASSTSRIILKLAIPSVLGCLSIFLLRKILKSKREDILFLTSAESGLSSKGTNCIKGSISSENMRLKESEPDSCSHIIKDSIQNGMANGNAQQNQINGQKKETLAVGIQDVEVTNGVSNNLKLKLRSAESEFGVSHQNGLKNDVNKMPQNNSNHASSMTEPVSQSSLNGLSHSNSVHNSEKCNEEMTLAASNGVLHKSEKSNGVVAQSSSSNGVSRSNKSKSKKKGKGRLPEKSNSCSVAPTINGSDKEATSLALKDSEKELSNEFSALSVSDEAPSIPEETTQNKTPTMDSNDSSTTQPETEQTFASNQLPSRSVHRTANSLPLSYSAVVKDCLLNNKQITDIIAKECDAVDITNSVENHCPTPESGRSSETYSETTESLQIDVNDPFSGELVASGGQSMLSSPGAAYCDSLGSNDSGRGGSELQFGYEPQPNSMVFEFELPTAKCGVLIGRKGYFVNAIKAKTNASVFIRNFPFEKEKKIVSVIGEESEVEAALKLIRNKFPFDRNQDVTLERRLPDSPLLCPPALKLALPEGVDFQVVLSATINAGHFFVQLPTHPSFHALPPFTMSMASMYSHCESPEITSPEPGNIVAAPVGDGWFRAEVVEFYSEDDTCKLKYLDYGGYQIVPREILRQINVDFMHMPFQATECYLAFVTCHEEIGWTEESKLAFENLAQGQILSAFVAGIAEDGIPCLYLYKVTGATNTFINQALVEAGYLKWIGDQ